jgi:hypothetical protein
MAQSEHGVKVRLRKAVVFTKEFTTSFHPMAKAVDFPTRVL